MKKVKMFFAAATLLLVTIAVFASKSKFSPFILYYYETSNGLYTQVGSSFTTLTNLNISGTGSAVSIAGSASKALYASDNGGSKVRVYTSVF